MKFQLQTSLEVQEQQTPQGFPGDMFTLNSHVIHATIYKIDD